MINIKKQGALNNHKQKDLIIEYLTIETLYYPFMTEKQQLFFMKMSFL